ncbi:hypothetical protein AaE_010166, partial [Aphanomyces astaci]
MEDDPKVSVEGLRGIEVQMRQLLQEEEYDSVVLLGSIFCSPAPMSPDKQLEHAVHDLNLVFADALVHKREYKRALRYYSSSLAFQYPKVPTPASSDMTSSEARVRFQIAKCMHHLDDIPSAIRMLDRIPPSRRTLGMNMLSGNLHLTQGSTRQAEVAFLAALTANPYAVEATLALAEIAGKNEERKPNPLDDSAIVHMYTELGETGGIDATDAAWLQSLVDAHIQLHSHQFQCPYTATSISMCLVVVFVLVDALESLDDMERVVATTHSLHCHLYRASVLMELECPEQAMASFVHARHCDAHNVLYMDVFAFLLKQAGLTMQLNSLVRDLFTTTEAHPQVWLAAACYSDLKGDQPAALQLCDRVRITPTFSIVVRYDDYYCTTVLLQQLVGLAISVDPSYARSYICRGYLLLALDRPEYAVKSFSHASKLAKTMDAYEGMSEGLCSLCLKGADKYTDAINIARLALMYMPHSPRAYLLLGSVLSLRPESRDKARKAFEKALSMRPKLLRAHFGLVDLLIAETKYPDAIARL